MVLFLQRQALQGLLPNGVRGIITILASGFTAVGFFRIMR